MRWSWRGAVALVLAVCVGVGYAVALVWAVVTPEPLDPAGGAILHTLGGAMVGGVVAWLSAGDRRDRDDEDHRPDQHERPGDL